MNVTVINQLIPSSFSPFSPFALTDVLTEISSETGQSFLHFWQLKNTLILGMKDTRVTDLYSGLQAINQYGYDSLVRNSGGLGVISDEGILNISIIFKKRETLSTTDEAYSYMKFIVARAFPELKIESFEVTDSYCPGTFDLSVNGKKIAGIAQRRVKQGIAVMLYLSVNGNQQFRGEIVRTFYQQSLREDFGKNGYPPVNPKSMTTLSDLLKIDLSINQIITRIQLLFHITNEQNNPIRWIESTEFNHLYFKKEQNMIERNKQIKEIVTNEFL